MNVSRPLVSIIIPVFNGSNYLREAIESALAQTYPNIEIIVVNDGSSDNGATELIARSFDDRIRYFSKKNGGVASALNVGIRHMSGDYFSWLSHDDIFYPDKISKQIDFIESIGKPVVLYSDYDVIDVHRTLIRTIVHNYNSEEFCHALVTDYPVHGCTVLIPKECFTTVGFFNENLCTTQDYDMWFRMAQLYDFIHMPMVLLQSRQHSEQGTITMSQLHIKECNEFLMDSMSKVLSTLVPTSSIGNERQFLAKCLTSFVRRGFHMASRQALFYYSRLLLRDRSVFELKAIQPIVIFFVTNINRIKNISHYFLRQPK